MLAQESPLVGDHSPDRLCVSWVHYGQFVLLRYGKLGPKCWTQGGGDRVREKEFIVDCSGNQAGGGLVPGRQSGGHGLGTSYDLPPLEVGVGPCGGTFNSDCELRLCQARFSKESLGMFSEVRGFLN